MNKLSLIRIIIIVEAIMLLIYTSSISRDYQDGWVLEGLEIPYAIFIITSIFYFMIEKQSNWLILLVLIIRSTLLLIPDTKYFWFQGVEIDQYNIYKLALVTYNEGKIAQDMLYSTTPLFPLSFTILSLVSGLSILQSMKYFHLMLWLTYPIWIFIITRKFNLGSSITKYALILSFISIKNTLSYLVIGQTFGAFFLFQILILFHYLFISKNRNIWIIITIFMSTLVGSHIVSSIILSTILSIVFLMLSILNNIYHKLPFNKIKPSSISITSVIIMSFTWFSIVTTNFFRYSIIFFEGSILKILNIPTSLRTNPFVPGRIWEIGFIDKLKIILVYYGADIFLLLVMAVVALIIIRDRELIENQGLLFLFFCEITFGFLFITGLLLNLGANWLDRILRYALLFAPIFTGILIKKIEHKLHSKLIFVLIISFLSIFTTLEFYRCQPLIPAANSLGKDLPEDIPLVYVNQVNTAYKRYLIYHAIQYIPSHTIIAMDKITGNQLYGFADSNFVRDHGVIYPLFEEPLRAFGKETIEPEYFLIPFPGISGKILEQAQNRTKSHILSIIYSSKFNVVYSNGESYMLQSIH